MGLPQLELIQPYEYSQGSISIGVLHHPIGSTRVDCLLELDSSTMSAIKASIRFLEVSSGCLKRQQPSYPAKWQLPVALIK